MRDKYIVNYRGQESEVIEWLHKNVQCASVSPSGRTGFDERNFIVFGVYTSKPWVYFKHEKDATWFSLRWA